MLVILCDDPSFCRIEIINDLSKRDEKGSNTGMFQNMGLSV